MTAARAPLLSQPPVVIPAYNEAKTIRDVVQRTLEHASCVIVVDDGSTDDTIACLHGLPVVVIRNVGNQGKAASIFSGAREALGRGARGIVTLDGDGQHDPGDLVKILAAAALRPNAIVIGARLPARDTIPRPRYVANRVANVWIGKAAGQPVADSQSGFRYYPATVFETLGLPHDRAASFVFESEVLIAAAWAGIELAFVPISVRYANPARASHLHPVFDIARIAAMIVRRLAQRRFDSRAVAAGVRGHAAGHGSAPIEPSRKP